MSTSYAVKRELTPEDALSKVKSYIGKDDLEIVFCRDYGTAFLLFTRSPGQDKSVAVKNAKVVDKKTGKVSEYAEADLEGKPWTANFEYGGNIWGTMR